uniref:Uncharacterized protein n=1 Tax=Setaria digitata TaxID=48799 RepID=A0A915PVM3_9BILA
MIIHIVRVRRTGKTIKSLFIADLRWAPELGTHRQQALYEERAARPKNPKPGLKPAPNGLKPPPPNGLKPPPPNGLKPPPPNGLKPPPPNGMKPPPPNGLKPPRN